MLLCCELPALTNHAGFESRSSDPLAFELLREAQWWLAHGFVGQAKGAPMHRNGMPTARLLQHLHGFFGIHVHAFHHPSRRVGTDGDHAEIHGPKPISDFPKDLGVAAIARMPDFCSRDFQAPATPVTTIPIKGTARREMLRGRGGDGPVVDAHRFPPRHFAHMREALSMQPPRMSLGDDDGRRCRESLQGGQIAVIVVRMRQQNAIDLRQKRRAPWHSNPPFQRRKMKRPRRAVVGKNRVYQPTLALSHDIKGSMPQPEDMKSRARHGMRFFGRNFPPRGRRLGKGKGNRIRSAQAHFPAQNVQESMIVMGPWIAKKPLMLGRRLAHLRKSTMLSVAGSQ